MIKRFVLVFSILINFSNLNAKNRNIGPAAKLEYHLNWDGKSSILKVVLDYTAASKDSTVFIYGEPNIGGQTEIFKVLRNIKCGSSERIKLNPKERKITVYHVGTRMKQISYEINGQLVGNPKRATVDELFRPLISSKILYLVPHFFMINPIAQHARVVGIQWDTFPQNLPYFISTAAESKASQKQTIAVGKKEDILILMGSDLVINKYRVHGIPYYSITSKSDTINNLKAELDPFFNHYFPDLRDFWKDDQAPYYYLCILPLLSIDKPWATGFGWGNGFIMKYSGKFNDDKKKVLAHETSHAWIGMGMQIGKDEFDNQWFGEGFNDYAMLINLVKSDILNKNAFLEHVNKENFSAHYTSPVKAAPNDSIASKFWTDRNYQLLPYKRGFIYAFYLDNQIRMYTGGTASIRDLLLNLFKINQQIKAKNPDAKLSRENFITAASLYLPKMPVKQEMETYMVKGTPIDFKKVRLMKGFKIEYRDSIPVLKISETVDFKKAVSW